MLRSFPSGRGFAAPAGVVVGVDPVAVKLADISGDGKLDVVVVMHSGGVRVVSGNGDGTLGDGLSYAAGSSPFDVAVGDFNGDGRPDVVVSSAGDDTVSVYLNDGDSLSIRKPYTLFAGANPTGVVTGDFSGDGRDDIAVMNTGSSVVSILTMAADGTVAETHSFSSGEAPAGAVAQDFDGDGLLDLAVVASTTPGALNVLYAHAQPSATIAATDATFGAGTITAGYGISGAAPHAGGTVTLRAYADPLCATAPIHASTVPFTGDRTYTASFTPPHASAYFWSAEYSGDTSSDGLSSPCAAVSHVAKAPTTVTTTGSSATVGDSIDGTATLTGVTPTGSVTLRAYATDDCSGTPAHEATGTSGSFTPAHAGSYRWVASYPGDGDNLASATPCASAAVSRVAKAAHARERGERRRQARWRADRDGDA